MTKGQQSSNIVNIFLTLPIAKSLVQDISFRIMFSKFSHILIVRGINWPVNLRLMQQVNLVLHQDHGDVYAHITSSFTNSFKSTCINDCQLTYQFFNTCKISFLHPVSLTVNWPVNLWLMQDIAYITSNFTNSFKTPCISDCQLTCQFFNNPCKISSLHPVSMTVNWPVNLRLMQQVDLVLHEDHGDVSAHNPIH